MFRFALFSPPDEGPPLFKDHHLCEPQGGLIKSAGVGGGGGTIVVRIYQGGKTRTNGKCDVMLRK